LAENGFKKNKDPSKNVYRYMNERKKLDDFDEDFQISKNLNNQLGIENFKSKQNIKTTKFIHKNANQEMRFKKESNFIQFFSHYKSKFKKKLRNKSFGLKIKRF